MHKDSIAVIESNRPWFYMDFRLLLQYRDLLYLMVRRELVSKYKQTLLGPLWYLLQPMMTALVFLFVFSQSLKVPTQGIPPLLFYLSGLIVWSYVSQTTQATSMVLVSNANLFKQVYFPRLILPLSQTLSFLVTFGFQFTAFFLLYLYYRYFTIQGAHFSPTSWIWMIPLFLIQIAALSFGLGLWVSALTVQYRDFHHLLSFMLMLWMYATPISYPIEMVPAKWWFVVTLNPLTPAMEAFRGAFFGTGMVSTMHCAYSFGITFFILISGILVFNRVERTFIDRV